MLHFPEKFENILKIKVCPLVQVLPPSYAHTQLDGVPTPFSPEMEGLMLMNVPNYAGGANPWGDEKSKQV